MLDRDVGSEYRFYLCGDSDIKGVKNRISKLDISHRIAHIGWIDENMKKEFFANALISVLPSYNEGLSMIILETMAYDILNISTSIASIPEVLHDCDNAFLITPGDVKILATRLRQLIGNEYLRHKFNEKSYKLITEKFSLVHNIEELKSIYRQQVN